MAQGYRRDVCDCKRIRFSLGEIKYLTLPFLRSGADTKRVPSLSSAIQHAMTEFGGNWEVELLSSRFLQPTYIRVYREAELEYDTNFLVDGVH